MKFYKILIVSLKSSILVVVKALYNRLIN